MDIERANTVLLRAIGSLQDGEIDSMSESIVRGVISYDVPYPGEIRGW